MIAAKWTFWIEIGFALKDQLVLRLVQRKPRHQFVSAEVNSFSDKTTASVRVRRGQQFFRQTVLNSYGVRCCISGINVPRLLVASHIKPWRDFPSLRLDPRNGLCLSTLHDAAFDAGLITLEGDLTLVLSNTLKSYLPQLVLKQNFVKFEGRRIRLPEKLAEPNVAFLSYHRRRIFRE